MNFIVRYFVKPFVRNAERRARVEFEKAIGVRNAHGAVVEPKRGPITVGGR